MLYGRDQDVVALLRPPAPVTVLSGDSGVGKTSVLNEVVARFDGIAPAPVPLGHAPAALQAGLLDALGSAAAMIAQEEGAARRVGSLLVEGGRRLARIKANEIGYAVARVVLGVVRDRVGDNLVDILTEYFEQVRNAANDDLVSRIRQAADPDVIYAIAGLAADVASAAEGRLLLTLDNIDGLQPDDRARLMDLGSMLPGGTSVICAFTSTHGAAESILDQYRLAGVGVYPLYGIEEWAVRQWLNAEGLPPDMASRIWRQTNGYGLAVADAVRLLSAGKGLAGVGDAGREELLRAATREALRALDLASRAAAYKLSVLAAPMPASHAAALLGMDSAGWIALEGLLIDNHLFLPGNPPWFHEQRRLLLRQQIPGDTVIPYLQAAVAQLSAIAQSQAIEESADTLVQYADLTDTLIQLGAADSAISAVGQLDDDSLGVLGAVVELTDGSNPGVDGEQALLYARQAFSSSNEVAAALPLLSAVGLVGTASNEYQTVIVAGFGSTEAWLYAVGRIANRLGRLPLPGIASLVFDIRLRDALGPFASAVYGIGDPSLGELAKRSTELQVRPSHMQLVRPGHKGPSLLLKGKFGDTPFYTAVAYEEPHERDSALSSVRALPSETIFGRPIVVEVVAVQPDAMLPTRRLLRAFERALGIQVGRVTNLFDVSVKGEKISREQGIRQQLKALNLLAELSNERERQVTGHSASQYGLLWWVAPDDEAELTAVVANAEGIIPITSAPTGGLGRMDRVELAQLAGLNAQQVVGFTQLHLGRGSQPTDIQPIVNEILRHARRIAAYNQHQARRRVTMDPMHLQALIQEQLDGRESTAQAVATSLGRSMPEGHDVFLLIEPEEHTRRLIPGPAGRGSTIIRAPMRGISPRAYVALGTPPQVAIPPSTENVADIMRAQWKTLLAEVFGVADATPTTIVHTSMGDAVAELLGHMYNEIWLIESDTTTPPQSPSLQTDLP